MRQITSLAQQTNNFTSILRNLLIAILQAQKCCAQKPILPMQLQFSKELQNATSLSLRISTGKPLIPSASNVILTPQTNLILLHTKKRIDFDLKQVNESFITKLAF